MVATSATWTITLGTEQTIWSQFSEQARLVLISWVPHNRKKKKNQQLGRSFHTAFINFSCGTNWPFNIIFVHFSFLTHEALSRGSPPPVMTLILFLTLKSISLKFICLTYTFFSLFNLFWLLLTKLWKVFLQICLSQADRSALFPLMLLRGENIDLDNLSNTP